MTGKQGGWHGQAASVRAGNKPPARASPLAHPPAPATQRVKPQPRPAAAGLPPSHQHHPPARWETTGHAAVWWGKSTVHARRIRVPQIHPPFAGATPGGVKQPPSTAEPAQGWVCPARFSLALPGLAPPAGQGPRQDPPQHGVRHCQGHAAETMPAGRWHPPDAGAGQG